MSRAIKYGDKSFRFLYYRYKDSIYYFPTTVITTVLVSVLLFIYVIVPQFQNWFSIRNEVIAVRSKINTLNQNINFMNNLDKGITNSQLQVATTTLPAEKDFIGLINVIVESALQSGVSVQDFSFRVGYIEQSSENAEAASESGLSPIQIAIEVNGSVNGVQRFLAEISEKIPLAEVLDIDGESRSTNINMQFYYKEFPKLVLEGDTPIEPVSEEKSELIRKLSGWETAGGMIDSTIPNGSTSAVPLF